MRIRKLTAATLAAVALTALTAGAAGADTHPAPIPARPVASLGEDLAAQQVFATQFGIATAVGGFTGTTAGAIIGCALGGIVTAPTIVFIPVGCLTGLAAGAGIGGIIGTIIVGGPALIASGAELIQVLTAPPGTTRYAVKSTG